MALTNTPEIKVNGHIISAAMINAEVQYHPADTRRKAMVKAAETLILGEVVTQRAADQGIKIGDDKAIDRHAALVDGLIDLEVSVPEATEEECLRYFEANAGSFKTAPLVEVSHILIASDPKDLDHRADSHALAIKLISRVKDGAQSFQELARNHSSCPSKQVGGSLGQVSHGQTVSEFERQVFAASEGLMPQPVESRYGYHVVFVARKVAGRALTYDMVSEKIKHYLDEKVQRKAISQYLHRLVSEAVIEGFEFDFDNSMLMQ